jgi:hypothetical protein
MSNNPTKQSGNPDGQAPSARQPTRAQRKAANQAAALAAQARELAVAAGIPPTLQQLRHLEAENHAAPVTAAAGAMLCASRGNDSHQGGELTARRGPGRPSEYTDELGDQLCAWIAAGGSLKGWCRHEGRAIDTVYRWMRQDARFHDRYARAHEDRADTLADEMLEIADEAAQDASIEGVAAAKLRVETRRWIAQKLRPQKWGERATVEHVGAVSIRIGIPQRTRPDNVVDAAEITPGTGRLP